MVAIPLYHYGHSLFPVKVSFIFFISYCYPVVLLIVIERCVQVIQLSRDRAALVATSSYRGVPPPRDANLLRANADLKSSHQTSDKIRLNAEMRARTTESHHHVCSTSARSPAPTPTGLRLYQSNQLSINTPGHSQFVEALRRTAYIAKARRRAVLVILTALLLAGADTWSSTRPPRLRDAEHVLVRPHVAHPTRAAG